MDLLYHISSDSSIDEFHPRPPPSLDTGVDYESVWAIDERHVVNYLLPRDCPRIGYYALPQSSKNDIDRLIGPSGSQHVLAIETNWFERALSESIWIYEFEANDFNPIDEGAGYHVSRTSVAPRNKREVASPIKEVLSLGVELRVMESLWSLRDEIVDSSLQYSCIRMRNANPRRRL